MVVGISCSFGNLYKKGHLSVALYIYFILDIFCSSCGKSAPMGSFEAEMDVIQESKSEARVIRLFTTNKKGHLSVALYIYFILDIFC
ncbi:hypothetical protein [Halobacteriovorax sp. YZS-3-1]|uniref:hypothetical protein n=1 Tax=Halobacteriovorax sp. YZS-3-1 TaxID=3391175 RepID=UPI00399B3778